ncbi:hypothetical protein [Streptomyces sp. NPDC097610]|uniref:hypothetical protein n=1 Tax=Streptomyces sp. NPDC097610 TaxID=3157227 RepID=UPI0033333700
MSRSELREELKQLWLTGDDSRAAEIHAMRAVALERTKGRPVGGLGSLLSVGVGAC